MDAARGEASAVTATGMSAFGHKADICECNCDMSALTQSGHTVLRAAFQSDMLSRRVKMASYEPWGWLLFTA